MVSNTFALIYAIVALLVLTQYRSLAQVGICQDNCVSSDRLTGNNRMTATRPHPWSQAVFPTKKEGFCKMGCQFFFSDYPKNTTCKRLCDFVYRYQTTVGYNDLAELAVMECRDGCDIELQVCQEGFYCTAGMMLPCPPGTFRESIQDLSVTSLDLATICAECPPGRYRPAAKGKSPLDCSLCPIGKYAGVTGSVLVSDCKRCPAGKTAEEEGMQTCKCITESSCDMKIFLDGVEKHFYQDGIDFSRETIPYVGRW